MENSEKRIFELMAIDSHVESNIVRPTLVEQRGKDWCKWGEENNYPQYIIGLTEECTTLSSCIDGLVDYICGDDIVCNVPKFAQKLNRKGETINDIVRAVARNIGNFAASPLQIIRSLDGDIAEVYVLKTEDVRLNKEGDVFTYSEDWSKRGCKIKTLTYPSWSTEQESPTSIFYIKAKGRGTYPVPFFASALKSCEIERSIDEFHLNSLENGFMGSYVVNFCNGIPNDEQKKQIEKKINEKFGGKTNAGRILVNFTESKDNMAFLQKMEIDDYGSKYESLAKRAEGSIFKAFRANPNLFGLSTEGSNGFNQEEYESSFRLFNRTMVKPIQRLIVDSFDKLFGVKGSITIKPFSMEGADNNIS